ncbi:MAG: helix-turn-helix domain-containing protein [Firmicutes bacterium]|nr:helix-turn-helix domain-containing protein [Bacillota bacterium]
MGFKEIFKQIRLRDGLGQREVAKELGVAQSLVSQWEAGKCTPNYETLEDIATLFNCDINYLLGFVSSKYRSQPPIRSEIQEIYNALDEFDKGQVLGFAKSRLKGKKSK